MSKIMNAHIEQINKQWYEMQNTIDESTAVNNQ